MKPFLSPINSASANNLRDELSTAQLSYFGRLDSNTTAGNSLISVITSTGSAPSNNNYNLSIGDTLAIANATTGSTKYVVSDTTGTNGILLTEGIDNLNANVNHYVVATRSAVHNVSFAPQNTITEGKWQILLKATNLPGENPSDGMPDQGGFDLNGLLDTDVSCPWGSTASVGTTVVLSSGISVGSTGSYHIVMCTLPSSSGNPSGTGETGTFVIGNTNRLINPAPAISHTVGQANASADTYTLVIRHLEADGDVNDTTVGKIALTESVKVTATIDPAITFYVDSIGASTPGMTRCGTTLSAGAAQTSATAVNFGSISLGQFNTLAQRLTCSTNAVSGYTVQVFENLPLTITTVGNASTIPDTTCDSSTTCSLNTANNWTSDSSSSKFGYSLEAINSSPVAFEAGVDFAAKPFGQGYANARTIMNRSETPSSEDRAYICYRVTASNFQKAGTYQNQISFIATATF